MSALLAELEQQACSLLPEERAHLTRATIKHRHLETCYVNTI